ncbi:copper amine oxidase N-terminal domain-containing protein [Ureibacillus aquaedulcis]|uniref:Copper amine oxidase N-terminal domain-containing protein n=1 Tax=Ureibacillus aquaedulcis TaxID=3058421 RepID=A0ABT8GL64_9BACL|nr:copper amine oxidase N-terminal domain-containing protein [Ureibacillus sp. BA0131]MDN4492157.1 copper amine oxidase N-terminal domain-containing protein [Ureibacillus sp. BA0131]
MLKKSAKIIISFILLIGLTIPTQAFASNKVITIVIDGNEISTDQPPIAQGGRTLVPLRAIFEGLKAKVNYNSANKTITATRGSTTIVLTLGSKNAIINNKAVQLDVPARVLANRTLVPVRFVSEAFGDDVVYNNSTKRVEITTKNNKVSNIAVKDNNDWGNGSDLQVSFTSAKNQSQIDHYRAMIVKTSKFASFNVNNSFNLTTNRYTTILKAGATIEKAFQSNTLDTDGELLQNDIDYTLVIASFNKNNRVLAYDSAKFTLTTKNKVSAVSNLRVKDASDFGDGRDLEITFNKSADESNLLQYRAIVVRSDEAHTFNLSAAKELSASNYTSIAKNGSNIKQVLSRSTRDNYGRLLQSGVTYKVFILSLGDHLKSYSSSLAVASNAITLGSNPEEIRITKLSVKDTLDYGDGRDLQVSFTAPTNDTRVTEYRVFVVREADAGKFTLTKAESMSSEYYSRVAKSSSADMAINLSSSTKSVDGSYIQSDIAYKVFVLSIGNQPNSYKNSLSTASPSIKLTNNQLATPVTNLVVKDISDWGDGRDIEVSFNKVADETKISGYRIMVVKSAQSNGFNLSSANSTSYYTSVSKTNANLKKALSSTTRDAFGEIIREGVEYKVFVLSVSSGGSSYNNALSAASLPVKLEKNTAALAVKGVIAKDVGDAGNGTDLEVSFNRITDETIISEYRIMVVRAEDSFDLTKANLVPAANYTKVSKNGQNQKVKLSILTKDVSGYVIEPDQPYVVYVLSVSNTGNINALSAPSAPAVTLSNPKVDEVTNVTVQDNGDTGNGLDLDISFDRAATETNISYYEVFVVKSSSNFTLTTVNSILDSTRKTKVEKSEGGGKGPIAITLNSSSKDVDGELIQKNVSYKIYVLSVADGKNAALNALSAASLPIALN